MSDPNAQDKSKASIGWGYLIAATVTGAGAIYAAIRAAYSGGLWARSTGVFRVSGDQAMGISMLLFIVSIWFFWKAIPRDTPKRER